MRIAVVVPSGAQMEARFVVALVSLFQFSERSGHDLVIINPQSSLIATGRNIGVTEALKRNVDYILFLDSDMVFPHTLLESLLHTQRRVVGATYVKRHLPTQFVHHETDDKQAPFLGEGVREVARLPTGAMLVKAEVFEAIGMPYFRCDYLEDGTELGEDYWFCDKVREAGYKVYLDADVSRAVGHLGVYAHTYLDITKE